jgi:hypothetical protein
MYKVYYLNVYMFSAPTRDEAVDKIMDRVARSTRTVYYEDYEILDGSDFL